MKVMNVGNVNYSNSKSQNFGMIVKFDLDARGLLTDATCDLVKEALKNETTKSGKHLKVFVGVDKEKPIADSLSFIIELGTKKLLSGLKLEAQNGDFDKLVAFLKEMNTKFWESN